MNTVSDTVLNSSDEKVETARQEPKTELNAKLVELGKVSDTSGGWVGAKMDTGAGFTSY
jgi:hypothetical protein